MNINELQLRFLCFEFICFEGEYAVEVLQKLLYQEIKLLFINSQFDVQLLHKIDF